MTIAFVAETTNTATSSATSIATTLASTVVGNLNIVGVSNFQGGALGSPTTLAAPSGWTVLLSGAGFLVCYRLYQSGDPTSMTVTSSGAAYLASGCAAYSGVDATTPVETYTSWIGASQPTATTAQVNLPYIKAPSAAPNHANDMLVTVMGLTFDGSSPQTISTPSGMTSRVANTYGPSLYMFDEQLSSGSPTGDKFASWSEPTNNAVSNMGMNILLKTSGDATTGTGAYIFNAGSLGAINFGSSTSFQGNLAWVKPQVGDLIIADFMAAASTITPPAGWNALQSSGTCQQFYTIWNSSSSLTPTFSVSSGTTYASVVFNVYRAQNAPGYSPVLDSHSLTTVSSGTSIASAAISPVSTNELLHVFFGTPESSGVATFTAPGGVTPTISSIYTPSAMVCDMPAPVTNPTATYTATLSVTAALVCLVNLIKLTAVTPLAQARPMQMIIC